MAVSRRAAAVAVWVRHAAGKWCSTYALCGGGCACPLQPSLPHVRASVLSRVWPNFNVRASQVHKNIRENPVREKKERSKPAKAERWHAVKLTLEERRENLKQKLAAMKEDDE